MEGARRTLSVRLMLEAEVYPSEEEAKVLRAMRTIIPFDEERDDVDIVGGEIKLIRVHKEGHEALIKLRNSLRMNKVLDTARSLLLTHSGRLRPLRFHKQAAFVGKVRLCDEEDISPLGVITLTIEYEGDPVTLADWLTPRTVKGRPVEEATTADLLYGRVRDQES